MLAAPSFYIFLIKQKKLDIYYNVRGDMMKKTIKYKRGKKTVEKEIIHIPMRYIVAMSLTVLEILLTIGAFAWLCLYVPYMWIVAVLLDVICIVRLISSDSNPDYKVPWLFFILVLPIAGFMLYSMFYSRKHKRKYMKRLAILKNKSYVKDDSGLFERIKAENKTAYSHAKILCDISESHLFSDTRVTYFSLGEEMYRDMLEKLECAEKFIYMEYFIIEQGEFWSAVLDILEKKAEQGVEVRVVFDDIGCMTTLPGNYAKKLRKKGIEATTFSRMRGNADNEFNNRSHRKITVIDGKIGYTGGINIADEYINKKQRFGHWKDGGIRLDGEGVWELTRLFCIDFGINVKKTPEQKNYMYPESDIKDGGYVVPFGDGPAPLYTRNVSKSIIQTLLSTATDYVYMTTPYLIIDNDLCQDIENTALRGVDVKIIVPGIPDKKMVSAMTKSFYHRLLEAGVKIYEYTPGFIHSKLYLADGKYAIAGTVNLDYRSLVHHFENGVWMYNCDCIRNIENDIVETLKKCEQVTKSSKKPNVFQRLFRSLIKIFAPLI